MSWEFWLGVLSGVLIIVVFLKSALNELVAKWIARWWQRRDEQKVLMTELYHRLGTLPNDYRLALLNRVPLTHDDFAMATEEQCEAYRQQGAGYREALARTQEFLAKHELRFPQPIRRQVVELRAKMKLQVSELHDPRAIFQRAAMLTDMAELIRTEIARQTRL